MTYFSAVLTAFLIFASPGELSGAFRYADSVTVKLLALQGQYQGSGVVIGEHPVKYGCVVLVATARHVVAINLPAMGWSHLDVSLDSVPAARVAWAAEGDAAVAEFHFDKACAGNAWEVAPLGRGSVSIAQSVYSMGYPMGHKFFAWGHIIEPSTWVREESGQEMEYISAALPGAPGHSGGPLLAVNGVVVGLLSAGYDRASMLSFWATVGQVRSALAQWPEWEKRLG